ncbi:MAG: AAA family ATPase [Planctomycetia bacterium]|nr:AAA family ATPase [Planctomycetia bacterium]
MGMIEGIRIRNFRTLKDVQLGKMWNDQKSKALTPMSVIIGKNGTGKSSLFDVFGFIADCLKYGVEEACDLNHRGGYDRIHSKSQEGPISFEIYFREFPGERPITYEFSIDLDDHSRPYVLRERLRQRRKGQQHGWPFSFLILNAGQGIVWKGESAGKQILEDESPISVQTLYEDLGKNAEESRDTEEVELEDYRKLGIAALGSLKQHPRISTFRRFIEGWYLSYFAPDSARNLPLAGPQKQLNVHGDNLSNVVQFMEREHPDRFQKVLDQIAAKIPGIDNIDTDKTDDGRILLRFYTKGFEDPFFAQQMSDGTLKVFTYLLLLASPSPAPLICIEEPENGLYHKLLETLALEFREYSSGKKDGSQVFITTHQPYFVNSLDPDEVWVLEKRKDGFSSVKRASSDPIIQNMVNEGLPLGSLWYSDYLDGTEGPCHAL